MSGPCSVRSVPVLLLAVLLGLAGGCASRARPAVSPPPSIRFVDVAAAAGIRFHHTSGASGRLYLAETAGSGCALFDYDGDGRLDAFFVNSSRLPGFTGSGPFYPALYRNRGNGTFEDVTKQAGLAIDCYGMGCAVGDYDNDGHLDLYLTALGSNHLFHNKGDGTFTDVTARTGVGDPRWSTSAAWLDDDRDGDLDLFVCNYCRWSPASNRVCPDASGRRLMCLPHDYPGESCALYRNRGNGTFADVTRAAGLYNEIGKALGVVTWDENGDGWPDLFVANDGERNLLYRNRGNGTFAEAAVEAGVAYSTAGRARAGMGADTGDIAGDGAETIAVGNFSQEGLGLFVPDPGGREGASPHYSDDAAAAGLLEPSLRKLSFGLLFCDVDLDSRKDLLVVNGHVQEGVEYVGEGITFRQRPLLFHNEGAGRFREVGAQSGPGLQTAIVGRGLACGDVDRDGVPDFLVSTNNGAPLLLRNDGGNRNHWLWVRAVGTKSNRDGIGTKVVVTVGSTRQQGWIRSGSSFCSASDLKALFGLGAAPQADSVTLTWPSGAVQTLTNVKADQVLTVREEAGNSRQATH
jgi:enediyne biosynthesis protein E4